ncbi:MAG TPA: ABC transporter ATP-binding protein [Acidobacteriota bacterium]
MTNLYRLRRYLHPYVPRMAAAVAAMFGVAIATAGIVRLLQPILDNALQPTVTQDELLRIAGGVVTLYLVLGIARFLSSYLMGTVGLAMVRDLRVDLFRHLEMLPLDYHARRSIGGLMSRVTSDVLAVQEALSRVLVDVLRDGMTVVGLVAVMFWFDWRLTLAVLALAPVLITLITRMGQLLRGAARDSQEGLGEVSTLLQEILGGMRIVKAFGMEEFEAAKFRAAAERLYRHSARALRLASLSSPLMEMIAALGGAAVLLYGAFRIQDGVLTTGGFFAFLVAAFASYSPLRRLGAANARVQAAAAAADRIFEILDADLEPGYAPRSPARRPRPAAVAAGAPRAAAEGVVGEGSVEEEGPVWEGPAGEGPVGEGLVGEEPVDKLPMPALVGGIAFRDVHFAYRDEDGQRRDVLHGVSFEIPAGRAVALVGRSGAGKSTIANLIPRFYDPTGGVVLIDGCDIRDVDLGELRGRIGLVTQETILFNDTVRNNIAYGRPSVCMEDVERAARAARAHSFIEELPQGYDTVLGERGLMLSGGQRQRIAIARALLKNAPILILDEATSSLDERSEREVQEALGNLMEGRTTLIIAHRLTTVRRTDLIVVLDCGDVVETGTHHELVARPGPYKDLYSLQFADTAAPG